VANPYIKYYQADFTGIFYSHEHAHLPFYQFHQIEWEQLKLENISIIEPYEAWEEQTSNAWYRKTLKPYKNFVLSRQVIWRWPKRMATRDFPWIRGVVWQGPVLRRRPHVIIPVNEQYQLQETLHEVVLKQITFLEAGKEWFGGYRRVKGVALFQIHVEPPKTQQPAPLKVEEPTVPETEVAEVIGNEPLSDSSNGVTNLWSVNQAIREDSPTISPVQTPLQMSPKGNRRWRWFILLWLLFCAWKVPALLAPSLLIIGAITFFRYFRKACLGLLVSLVVFALVGYVLLQILPGQGGEQETVKTEDGTVKILPPKPNKEKDLMSEKSITWWDFIQHKYHINYTTSATRYFESTQYHEEQFQQINATNNLQFYSQLYRKLDLNDVQKLDSIVAKLQENARRKHLNALQTAEMVCTFVQEIPYFLVHDFSCKQAVAKSNSDFMVEYHRSKKPCLPNVPGGVQSPYEFMHNLKGDCDTRSLLAFTLLRSMGIPSSVWISEAYGHSVLGVALPMGSGFYKEINGVRHYAVELTAKGFRLGMISPEQQVQNNWDIALFLN
jgi:hypothetical protein